jgi:hypothetical protein
MQAEVFFKQFSITLVGELLFKVSGISGKASELDEDDVAAEATSAVSPFWTCLDWNAVIGF